MTPNWDQDDDVIAWFENASDADLAQEIDDDDAVSYSGVDVYLATIVPGGITLNLVVPDGELHGADLTAEQPMSAAGARLLPV